jgi:hypothetical protein
MNKQTTISLIWLLVLVGQIILYILRFSSILQVLQTPKVPLPFIIFGIILLDILGIFCWVLVGEFLTGRDSYLPTRARYTLPILGAIVFLITIYMNIWR